MTEHYLTEERRMIQEVAREFTAREVLPVANELDPVQGDIPEELKRKMGELGYFGIRMPEEHGGLGLGVFEYCLIAEELARGWMSVASIIARAASLMGVGGWPEEQRLELTRKAARGEYLAAVALSEPNAGSDLAGVSCKAVLDGDEWVITGNKYWCTFADGADYIQLLARVEAPADPNARHTGMKTFIIEKPRGELPQGCQGAPIPKIGYFGWKTWELAFDGCRIPKENVITGGGGGGEGFKNAVNFLNVARAHTAARSIGLARGALEDAMARAVRRAHRRLPGDPLQAGAHGQRRGGGPAAHVSRRDPDGHRRARRQGGRHGKMVRKRDGRAGDLRRPADPRRRRLYQAPRRGTPLARRPAHEDLRGHQRDSAADHLRPHARPAIVTQSRLSRSRAPAARG